MVAVEILILTAADLRFESHHIASYRLVKNIAKLLKLRTSQHQLSPLLNQIEEAPCCLGHFKLFSAS